MSNPLNMVLVLDTETTGFDPEENDCIEVAGVMYSVEHACVIESYASLIAVDGPNDAEPVNHISEPSYKQWGATPEGVWERVALMAEECDAILAHNADFDRQWVPGHGKGAEHLGPIMPLHTLPWIDTCNGVRWPKQSRDAGSLINLAFEHGLGIVDPHRALSDCLLIGRLLQRCAELGHDVRSLLRRGLRPMATFEARLPYDRRQEAKDAGFKWKEIEGRSKNSWVRKLAVEDATELGFEVLEIDPRRVK